MKWKKVHVVNFLSIISVPEFGIPAIFPNRLSERLLRFGTPGDFAPGDHRGARTL